jgi:predicted  nucleic acid-binding Zn-ribbon protein
MMDLNTGLLITVAFCTCYIYFSSTQQIENLQQDIKTLQEKLAQLEKTPGGKETCSVETHSTELKEFSQLKEKIDSLQADVEHLGNLLREHKEEDQEDKLCLIEVMKRIGKFLGQDGVSVEAAENATTERTGDTVPSKVEEGMKRSGVIRYMCDGLGK